VSSDELGALRTFSIFREKQIITGITPKSIPFIMLCGYELRFLLPVATTAPKACGWSEPLQFSFHGPRRGYSFTTRVLVASLLQRIGDTIALRWVGSSNNFNKNLQKARMERLMTNIRGHATTVRCRWWARNCSGIAARRMKHALARFDPVDVADHMSQSTN